MAKLIADTMGKFSQLVKAYRVARQLSIQTLKKHTICTLVVQVLCVPWAVGRLLRAAMQASSMGSQGSSMGSKATSTGSQASPTGSLVFSTARACWTTRGWGCLCVKREK